MKPVFAILIVLVAAIVAKPQLISGAVDILTIYSQNERFYLRSIPYDDESPSLRRVAVAKVF